MRPGWAQRGAPNVLSARGSDAIEKLKAHADRSGLKIVETETVLKGPTQVTFARCEPKTETNL